MPRPSMRSASWLSTGMGTNECAQPITEREAIDTIGARIRRRLEGRRQNMVQIALAERLERLRKAQLRDAAASMSS